MRKADIIDTSERRDSGEVGLPLILSKYHDGTTNDAALHASHANPIIISTTG